MGRYGAWNKGVLADSGYTRTVDVASGRVTVDSLRPHNDPCTLARADLLPDTAAMMGCSCS